MTNNKENPAGAILLPTNPKYLTAIDNLLAPLRDANWAAIDDISPLAEVALRSLAKQPAMIGDLFASAAHDQSLFTLCEHYDLLDKIVLYRCPQFRLRLHVFLPGYFDRPHNHRWSYSSLILCGQYRHSLYGCDDNLTTEVDVASLTPVMIRNEQTGMSYTLHHSMIHSVVAQPYTVSLVIRGPSMKDRFVVMDRVEKTAWWQYGSANESKEERTAKAMSLDRFKFLEAKLAELSILEA
jgi:hypothetical protein